MLLLLIQPQHPQPLFRHLHRQQMSGDFMEAVPSFIAGVARATGLRAERCVSCYTIFEVLIQFHTGCSTPSTLQTLDTFWLQFPINMRYWTARLLKQQCWWYKQATWKCVRFCSARNHISVTSWSITPASFKVNWQIAAMEICALNISYFSWVWMTEEWNWNKTNQTKKMNQTCYLTWQDIFLPCNVIPSLR